MAQKFACRFKGGSLVAVAAASREAAAVAFCKKFGDERKRQHLVEVSGDDFESYTSYKVIMVIQCVPATPADVSRLSR